MTSLSPGSPSHRRVRRPAPLSLASLSLCIATSCYTGRARVTTATGANAIATWLPHLAPCSKRSWPPACLLGAGKEAATTFCSAQGSLYAQLCRQHLSSTSRQVSATEQPVTASHVTPLLKSPRSQGLGYRCERTQGTCPVQGVTVVSPLLSQVLAEA